MSDGPVVLIGDGGHAKLVIDVLERQGREVIATLAPDDVHRLSERPRSNVIAAISDNRTRAALVAQATQRWADLRWTTAVHPSAIVAADVAIGEGAVILAGAIINPSSSIGRHAILNTGTTLDHDATIGPFAQLGTGCVCSGDVTVGDRAFVGVGTRVLAGVTIGEDAVIGAGAVTASDVPAGKTIRVSPST